MDRVFGVCGLECSECPAYIAYKTDDNDLRIKTAKQWAEWYNADFKPEQINCVGCMEEGEPKVGHCSQCEVRACGIEQKVTHCSACSKYSCERIEKYFEFLPPEAKENLENLKKKL